MKSKKFLVLFFFIFNLLPTLNVNGYSVEDANDESGIWNNQTGFRWRLDWVEYDNEYCGIPGDTRYERIVIRIGEIESRGWRPFEYFCLFANDTENQFSGSIQQRAIFLDEEGVDWSIELQKGGYNFDINSFLPYFSNTPDLLYLKNNPDFRGDHPPCGNINISMIPPQIIMNNEGIEELTWSHVAYLFLCSWDSIENKQIWDENLTIKATTRWHFFVKESKAHLKMDFGISDLIVNDYSFAGTENFENATFMSEWSIDVWTSSIITNNDNTRPDSFEIDGVLYTEPAEVPSGANVSIKYNNTELSQIDLGKTFLINDVINEPITTKSIIVPQYNYNNPELEQGFRIRFQQNFPKLNYSEFSHFEMDPEIKFNIFEFNQEEFNPLYLIIGIGGSIGIILIIISLKKKGKKDKIHDSLTAHPLGDSLNQ